MTPEDLAQRLGITPKALRAWLRTNHPRSSVEKHQRWELDSCVVDAATHHFSGPRARPAQAPVTAASAPTAWEHDLAAQAEEFAAAPLFTRVEVLARPCPVPAAPGVYGWWFRRLPVPVDASQCLTRDGCTLLYTGISPKRPPANGAPSRQNLRTRLTTHYAANAEGSTLRKTLGVLLSDELGIKLRRVGSGHRMTFVEGERRLSEWMADHALVAWVAHPEPWLLEDHLIANTDVPLNLQGNAHNRFHSDLTQRRAAAVAQARQLPVVPNPGVGGR